MVQMGKLLLAGTLPLAAGTLLNILLGHMPFEAGFAFSVIISFSLALLWAYVSYITAEPGAGTVQQALILCLCGMVMLAFAVTADIQNVYFLPLYWFAYIILFPLTSWFGDRSLLIYGCELMLMLALSLAGCALKNQKKS